VVEPWRGGAPAADGGELGVEGGGVDVRVEALQEIERLQGGEGGQRALDGI
jgi:hypothetical protein